MCPEGMLTLNTIYNLYLTSSGYDLSFVLAVLNSRLVRFYWLQRFFDNKETFPKIKKRPLLSIPVVKCEPLKQRTLARAAAKVTSAKRSDPAADTTEDEAQIDRIVYDLYGLTEDEIAIVEGRAK